MEQFLDTARETKHVARSAAPAARADASPRKRHDIYAGIHKALRAALADTLPALGRLDTGDPQESAQTLAALRDVLAFCRDHIETENAFVHPAMEDRRPGSTRQIADEHREHEAAIASLEAQADALLQAPQGQRDAMAAALYGAFAHFVGENLVHMHEEETVHNPVLWSDYADAELRALEDAIRAHHPAPAMARALRWMLPALPPAERAAMLAGIRANAPEAVFAGMLALARSHVDAAGMRKLDAALAA
jgi:hypothetical protein